VRRSGSLSRPPTSHGAVIEPGSFDVTTGTFLNVTLLGVADLTVAFTNVGQRNTTLISTEALSVMLTELSEEESLNAVFYGQIGSGENASTLPSLLFL
jgi:hypothetical protein